jgi:hypothetical protein
MDTAVAPWARRKELVPHGVQVVPQQTNLANVVWSVSLIQA